MRDLFEQRVLTVSTVDQLVAPGPGPDDIGQWRVTCTDSHTSETVVLEVCDPPEVGAFLFVEVVSVGSAAPAGSAF